MAAGAEVIDTDPNYTSDHGESTIGATLGAAAHSAPERASGAVPLSDLVLMDGASLASIIRSRQASCVEVMTAYLDHIEKLEHISAALNRGIPLKL
jgi:hypothetical protein